MARSSVSAVCQRDDAARPSRRGHEPAPPPTLRWREVYILDAPRAASCQALQRPQRAGDGRPRRRAAGSTGGPMPAPPPQHRRPDHRLARAASVAPSQTVDASRGRRRPPAMLAPALFRGPLATGARPRHASSPVRRPAPVQTSKSTRPDRPPAAIGGALPRPSAPPTRLSPPPHSGGRAMPWLPATDGGGAYVRALVAYAARRPPAVRWTYRPVGRRRRSQLLRRAPAGDRETPRYSSLPSPPGRHEADPWGAPAAPRSSPPPPKKIPPPRYVRRAPPITQG